MVQLTSNSLQSRFRTLAAHGIFLGRLLRFVMFVFVHGGGLPMSGD